MAGKSKERALARSADMAPVEGTVDVDVPLPALWEAFTHADRWPRWNRCMLWVRNRELVPGRQLLWVFRPIRRWYPYVLPAIAKVVEVKDKKREKVVTWEVTALPGFYARHTYHMKDLGRGRTRFGSWEKAMGRGFRLTKWFWMSHFVFVKDRSLEGARFLEEVYLLEGQIDESALALQRGRGLPRSLLFLRPAFAVIVTLWWFYDSYRLVSSAEGRGARVGRLCRLRRGRQPLHSTGRRRSPASGGSQVFAGFEAVARLNLAEHRTSREKGRKHALPHYDHTEGDVLYPEAAIFAHEHVPDLILFQDNEFNRLSGGRITAALCPPRGLMGGTTV